MKIQFASSQWNEAPPELIELRDQLGYLGILGTAPMNNLYQNPMEFGATLLTANETRGKVLMNALKEIYFGNNFWSVQSFEDILNKNAWVCRHIGIESNPDVVHGKCSMEENLDFWKKVFQAMPDIKAGPEETKLWMESTLLNCEAKMTWLDFIDSVTQRVTDTRAVAKVGGEVPKITINDVVKLERLHANGMTSDVTMKRLKDSIEQMISETIIPDECFPESRREVKDVLETGKEICGRIVDFLDFMKSNDNFVNKKTEFLICHVDTVLKTMIEVLQLHRVFLQRFSVALKNTCKV